MTQERLKELLHYDPETGMFTWKLKRTGGTKAGDIAGAASDRGYIKIKIGGKTYSANKLAWLYMTGSWPPIGMIVDHADLNTRNNAWANLRLGTQSQNSGNQKVRQNNKSGLKGVSRKGGRWVAQIQTNGTKKHLGYFGSKEDAHAAYIKAAKEYFGDFANDGT